METITKKINIEVKGIDKLMSVIENDKEIGFVIHQLNKELKNKNGGCYFAKPDAEIAEKYNIKKFGDLHILLSSFKDSLI